MYCLHLTLTLRLILLNTFYISFNVALKAIWNGPLVFKKTNVCVDTYAHGSAQLHMPICENCLFISPKMIRIYELNLPPMVRFATRFGFTEFQTVFNQTKLSKSKIVCIGTCPPWRCLALHAFFFYNSLKKWLKFTNWICLDFNEIFH